MGKSKKYQEFNEIFKMAPKLGLSFQELEYCFNKLGNAGKELMKTMNNHRRESMKRELILDEVKYDGEYYSTRILKQTHRGEEFTPNSITFNGGGFSISSACSPEIMSCNLFVLGYDHSKDNDIIKTKDKSTIDKALAAVKAYNEEFGCDENLETARNNFIEAEEETLFDILQMIGRMKHCSREEFMELKKHIYTEHANINLSGNCCVYCLDFNSGINGVRGCSNCDYGEKNGACNDAGSVYRKIETARNELVDALSDY